MKSKDDILTESQRKLDTGDTSKNLHNNPNFQAFLMERSYEQARKKVLTD